MPPRSFVEQRVLGLALREPVEVVREHALQEGVRVVARRPAAVPCARRRTGRLPCARRAPRRSPRRTAPASPNRRRGRGARPTPRGVRTAACAAARPAPRRTIPAPTCAGATKLTSCASALAARASSSLMAPIEQRNANSSRRWVRIISGPSVETVTRTPASRNVRKTERTASASASAPVSRFEVGHTSSTMPVAASSAVSSGSPAARMPCPMRSGRSASITSPTSSGKPSSPQCTVTPRPASRACCTSGASGA